MLASPRSQDPLSLGSIKAVPDAATDKDFSLSLKISAL